mgnify:CR=1 FL=1
MKKSSLPYLKKVQTSVVNAVNEDGLIYDAKKETFAFVTGTKVFTMWFSTLQPVIRKITRLTDLKLLYWIGENLSHDEGKVCLTKHFKEIVEKEMGISQPSINRGISFFKEIGLLIPHSPNSRSAIFYIHPSYLWKGGTTNRQKAEDFILRKLRTEKLPDLEKKVFEDIMRYEIGMQQTDNSFDFSKVSSGRQRA